ncbi:MAG: (d)CMP kinase [Bacteroides sp.]
MKRGLTIAIDGLSSCGKSTFAKALAQELGYIYVDTGAMYRAVTLAFLRAGIQTPEQLSETEIESFLSKHTVSFVCEEGKAPVVTLDGEPLGDEIRGSAVSSLVSPVAALPAVRRAMVAQQRVLGREGGVVMDGRDIGQTVFPNAELKIFMVASDTVRAQRRFDELKAKGIAATYEEVLGNLRQRDQIDQTRACDPMRKAPDAIELDNSEMTPAQQMEWILPIVQERLQQH